jgi:putative ABC transport system permease protein
MNAIASRVSRMRIIASIALRNLLRGRGRTAFGLSAVVFGVLALVLAGGFINWSLWSLREETIAGRYGHLQVSKPDYFEVGFSDPYRYLMPENPSALERIRATPGVTGVSPRLIFTGLVSYKDATVSFYGEGVEPQDAALGEKGMVIVDGTAIAPGEKNAVLLGKGVAASLGARANDTVILLANTPKGGINAVEARVAGVFASPSKAFEDIAIRLPRGLASQLTRTRGAHTWVVSLDDTDSTGRVFGALEPSVRAAGYELTPWNKLADFYNKSAALFTRQTAVMKLIIVVIIVLCISNTMLMTVAERTGEIGTSMALGLKRRTIFAQFLVEGTLLGLVGGALGLVLGYGLAQLISAIGIPMPPPPDMSIPITGEIRVDAALLLEAFAIALATTIAASAYPAWRAGRMEIVNALRFNR